MGAAGALAFSASVRGERRGDALIVTIDNPPVNATSADVRRGLMRAIEAAEADAEIAAVVLTGAGAVFIGGADIREFGQPPVEPHLPDVIARIEACVKPVVAALGGAALGGGLEVALGCHGRVSVASAKLGLPEVKLGIVPGAGGTQRLPRLVAAPAAAEMIASGRSVGAEEAFALDLLDAVAPASSLIDEAVALARGMVGAPLRRTGALPAPAADEAGVDAAVAKTLRRAKGRAAPQQAVALVKAASALPFAEGLALERKTFLALRDGEEAAALRHVFFAERAAAKVEGLEGVAPRPIVTVGVVGLGLMGAGIVTALLGAGLAVIGVETTAEAAQAGRARVAGLLDEAVKAGRITPEARDAQLARFSTHHALAALAPADLVIEAVFDDLAVKTELFQKLDAIVAPDAILATNTSYLDPDVLAAATARPERIVGLHFFSPAHVMRLAEVVRCARTAPLVLAGALALAKRMGKLAVVCGVTEGFIGNRVFSAYRREAEFLVEDGASPQQIDTAMEAFGMAMGPFAVFDMAGLQIAWARRKRQAATRDPAQRYVDIADRLCEAGRLGRAVGKGWYAYEDGKRRVDPEVEALIAAARAGKGLTARQIPEEEIVARLLGAMAQEGAALLREKIAARASDVDLVMINGYGFPAHKGGPMFLAERQGARA
jgi:3-hydroxyacyl-CoA dehydrogenase